MVELKKEMLELLDDTLKYYSEDTNRRCIMGTQCVYDPVVAGKQGISEGCAIGRHMTKEAKAKITRLDRNNRSVVGMEEFLPEKLTKLPMDFLARLQCLHDSSVYWNTKGISEFGLDYVDSIRRYIHEY